MQTMFKIAGTVNGKLVLMTQSGIVFKCQVKNKSQFVLKFKPIHKNENSILDVQWLIDQKKN